MIYGSESTLSTGFTKLSFGLKNTGEKLFSVSSSSNTVGLNLSNLCGWIKMLPQQRDNFNLNFKSLPKNWEKRSAQLPSFPKKLFALFLFLYKISPWYIFWTSRKLFIHFYWHFHQLIMNVDSYNDFIMKFHESCGNQKAGLQICNCQ